MADQIIKDFDVKIPDPAGDREEPKQDGSEGNPTGLSNVRNALVPENTQSAKFTTTAGPNLKVVSGTVYIGPYAGHDARILWIKIEERIYPTGHSPAFVEPTRVHADGGAVYSLWQNPGVVPLLHTPSIVMQKLRGGADLMTPGLGHGPPFPPSAVKEAIVAVASLEDPSVPLMVGVCEIDVASLTNVRGEKGRAVSGFHWQGDELWNWSLGGKAGSPPPSHLPGWNDGTVDDLGDQVEGLGLGDDDDDGGAPLPDSDANIDHARPRNNHVQGEDGGLFERVDVHEQELTTKGQIHGRSSWTILI